MQSSHTYRKWPQHTEGNLKATVLRKHKCDARKYSQWLNGCYMTRNLSQFCVFLLHHFIRHVHRENRQCKKKKLVHNNESVPVSSVSSVRITNNTQCFSDMMRRLLPTLHVLFYCHFWSHNISTGFKASFKKIGLTSGQPVIKIGLFGCLFAFTYRNSPVLNYILKIITISKLNI